jgi:LmbE family N-acetylglucosaminyl deacetylase
VRIHPIVADLKRHRVIKKMRVLAIGAHPDDLEINCGGTLAKYVKLGHEVVMAYVTNGDMGHFYIQPEEMAKIRKEEARRASRVIGGKFMWLGLPDEWVFHDQKTRLIFIDMIREARPDVIITHDPDDYHPDHVTVSELVFAASFLATVPHIITKHNFLEKLPAIFYMDTYTGVGFLPDDYVDITMEIDKKLEALSQHKSQVEWLKKHDRIDILDYARTSARFRGFQAGVTFAEAFKKLKNRPGVYARGALP